MVARTERYLEIGPYLGLAVIATIGVVVAPTAIVLAVLAFTDPDPSVLATSLLGVFLSVGAATIGSALWQRRPESADLSFGELMLWGWFLRRRSERRLEEGAGLLGLDRRGLPAREITLSPQEQLKVLHDLTAALESKDPYTHGHSWRVERHSYRTAAAMGLHANEIEHLRRAAALHDVGKIRIPDRILRKPGPLTVDERLVLEEHPLIGSWMVSSTGNPEVIAAVRHHHERWDGRGYPDGLAGTDIPLFSRIIGVADAYDALTSTRPYRASRSREEATSIRKAERGSQFDPEVVDAFLSSLPTRVPVAGFLLLLVGPQRLLRQLAYFLRKMGAGTIAPAASAAGAAAMVTASAFAPVPPPAETPRTTVAVEQSAESAGLGLATDTTDDRSGSDRARTRLQTRDVGPPDIRVQPSTARLFVAAASAPIGEPPSATTDTSAPEDPGPGPGPRPDPQPESSQPQGPPAGEPPPAEPPPSEPPPSSNDPEPDPTPEPQPAQEGNPSDEPPPEDKGNQNPPRDPQPDKGRDCEEEHGDGQGHDKHCGG